MRCKFILVLLALLVVFSFASFVSAFDSASCPSGMVSLWKFDEISDTSTSFIDSFGTYTGSITQVENGIDPTAGKIGTSVNFVGEGYLKIPHNTNLQPAQGAVVGWVSPASNEIYDDFLINKGVYYLRFYGGEGVSAQIKAKAGTTEITSTAVLVSDVWYFIVLTWSSTETKLYIYGASGKISENTGAGVSSLTGSSDLFIGKENAEAQYNYKGLIDELALYSRALTPTEISAHYALGTQNQDYCYSSSGISSDTKKDFSLLGCDNVPGVTTSLAVDTCLGEGVYAGQYYCDSTTRTADKPTLLNTLQVAGACEKSIIKTGDDCCPAGYVCNIADGETQLICNQRLQACENYTTQQPCEADSCYWIDGRCVDPNDPSLGCNIYRTDTSCKEDVWNFGQTGAGTNICGTYTTEGMVIPQESCGCEWDGSSETDGDCWLNYTSIDEIYGFDGNNGLFNCLKLFSTSPCVEGSQIVNWTVKTIPSSGISQEKLVASQCVNGTVTRSCGQPIVTLPFFSWINVLLVVFVLGIFYWVFRD